MSPPLVRRTDGMGKQKPKRKETDEMTGASLPQIQYVGTTGRAERQF